MSLLPTNPISLGGPEALSWGLVGGGESTAPAPREIIPGLRARARPDCAPCKGAHHAERALSGRERDGETVPLTCARADSPRDRRLDRGAPRPDRHPCRRTRLQ